MAFTGTLSTDVGKTRLLIPDRDEATAVFQDDAIEAFLAMEGDVRRAAALALETIAADTAMTLRVTTVLGISVNGVSASAELLKRAARLREQAAAADEAAVDGGLFDIAEMIVDPFGRREYLAADALRSGL
ncbi:MAG: hypothetical protein ACLGI3_00770 [Actinomycetes bacterium]